MLLEHCIMNLRQRFGRGGRDPQAGHRTQCYGFFPAWAFDSEGQRRPGDPAPGSTPKSKRGTYQQRRGLVAHHHDECTTPLAESDGSDDDGNDSNPETDAGDSDHGGSQPASPAPSRQRLLVPKPPRFFNKSQTKSRACMDPDLHAIINAPCGRAAWDNLLLENECVERPPLVPAEVCCNRTCNPYLAANDPVYQLVTDDIRKPKGRGAIALRLLTTWSERVVDCMYPAQGRRFTMPPSMFLPERLAWGICAEFNLRDRANVRDNGDCTKWSERDEQWRDPVTSELCRGSELLLRGLREVVPLAYIEYSAELARKTAVRKRKRDEREAAAAQKALLDSMPESERRIVLIQERRAEVERAAQQASTMKTTLIPRRVEPSLLRQLHGKSRLGVEVPLGDGPEVDLPPVGTESHLAAIDKNMAKRAEGRAPLAFQAVAGAINAANQPDNHLGWSFDSGYGGEAGGIPSSPPVSSQMRANPTATAAAAATPRVAESPAEEGFGYGLLDSDDDRVRQNQRPMRRNRQLTPKGANLYGRSPGRSSPSAR
ncbi:unnamed protein product [Zymoseptoria tritici ST99CH_1A5]|uniref:Uncharacterized protein n=1 Tax=Zymoseptoria tritici ST99CH_1A5 TaxID=1276529 RepID=A0A1Y6LGT1_ZYMTR|nr:unnamed protein product [Zymoseptoria tritici ST99CH_1A5]